MKRQISKWEKVLMTHNQQNSYTRIFKELLQNNIKKTHNPIRKKKKAKEQAVYQRISKWPINT